MSDYISREAAIEKIRVAVGCAECGGNSSTICCCGVCDVNNAIRLIKRLPAADVEPVRRWIPCSERMPDTETEVMALCRRGGVSFVCPAMHEDGTIITSESIWNWSEIEGYGLYSEEADDWFIPEGWWEYRRFNDDDVYNNLIDCTVTHWMPLPEPPKEEDDETIDG